MKKIIFVFIMILVFSSCTAQVDNNNQDQKSQQENEQAIVAEDNQLGVIEKVDQKEEGKVTFANNFSKVKDVYKNEEEFNSCMDNSMNSCLSQSIGSKMRESQDIALCDDYISESNKKSCKDSILLSSTVAKKSFEACTTLSENIQTTCNRQVAYELAIEQKDLSICEKISDDEQSMEVQGCKGRIASELAQKESDKKYCNDLDEGIYKDDCLSVFESRISLENIR